MRNAACEVVIQEYCGELQLAAVVRDYPELCRRARDSGWTYKELLRELSKPRLAIGIKAPRAGCRARRASRCQNRRPARLGDAQESVAAENHGAGQLRVLRTRRGRDR